MDIQRQNFLKECDAQNKAEKFAKFKKELMNFFPKFSEVLISISFVNIEI